MIRKNKLHMTLLLCAAVLCVAANGSVVAQYEEPEASAPAGMVETETAGPDAGTGLPEDIETGRDGEEEKEDRAADDPTRQFDGLAAFFGASERTLLHIDLDEDISAVERSIALDYRRHSDGGDGTEYMLRSRMTRMSYRGQTIEPRVWAEPVFHRGDIVVVNDNLEHYRAELQVVLKDMPNDGQRNHIGRITPKELFLLDALGPRITFLLEEV